MKIELLRRREPFETLFRRTAAAALPEIWGGDFELAWVAPPRRPGPEHWVCNDRLNAIHAARCGPEVRRAVRRHYGYHRRPGRALLQRAYAAAAASGAGQRLVASAWLRIAPRPEAAAVTLFRGGGRRIRLMDYDRRAVWILPKVGVAAELLAHEIEVRRRLPAELPAPPILEVDREGRWLAEGLCRGVPLDQVAERGERARAWDLAAEHAGRWLAGSLRQVGLAEHLAVRRAELEGRGADTAALALLDRLEALAAGLADSLEVGPSHGDLTGDNVLFYRGEVAITDWELAGERHRGYTAIDVALANRPGWPERLRAWVASPPGRREALLVGGGETAESPDWRRLAALLWIADKLGVHALTALSPHQPAVGAELGAFVAEAKESLDSFPSWS